MKIHIKRMAVEGGKGEWKNASGKEFFFSQNGYKRGPQLFSSSFLFFSLTFDSWSRHSLSTVGPDAPARRTNTGSVYAACRPTNTHFRQLAPIDSSRRKLTPTLAGVEMAA
jgi:hypothetical protein